MSEGLNGASNPSEISNQELSIEERKGAIVIWLGKKYMILPPDQALGVGEVLMRYAHHAKTGEEKTGTKTMSDMIQRKLENRIMLVIADLQEKKKKPMFVAKEILGIVMREVT